MRSGLKISLTARSFRIQVPLGHFLLGKSLLGETFLGLLFVFEPTFVLSENSSRYQSRDYAH